MSQEDQGFTVHDRRHFSENSSPCPDQPESEAAPQAQTQGFEQLPPVEFSSLIISLSHAAMIHLGHIPDPASGQPHKNLTLARHTIDTIGMLKDKTQSNLSQDEQRLIDGALTELRLAFVQVTRGVGCC